MDRKEYYSCNIIERGFDAQIDSINLCCRVGNNKNAEKKVLIPNYNGEKINWEEFFKTKQEIINLQKEGKPISQCEGCVYLEKKEWGTEKYISAININNWIKCNANCIYCDRKNYKNKKEYNIYPIIKELLKKDLLKNPADITIAGGEPTISKDFDRTIKLLIEKEITQVRILTNSIKFNKYIQKGLEKNLINILISTDSGTRETYKKIKLVDKHDIVWKNIEKYCKKQANDSLVKTKYILIPNINTNRNEIKNFLSCNARAGVKHSYIDIEIGYYLRFLENKEFKDELYNLFLYAKEEGNKLGINVEPFDRMKLIENN